MEFNFAKLSPNPSKFLPNGIKYTKYCNYMNYLKKRTLFLEGNIICYLIIKLFVKI